VRLTIDAASGFSVLTAAGHNAFWQSDPLFLPVMLRPKRALAKQFNQEHFILLCATGRPDSATIILTGISRLRRAKASEPENPNALELASKCTR